MRSANYWFQIGALWQLAGDADAVTEIAEQVRKDARLAQPLRQVRAVLDRLIAAAEEGGTDAPDC